MSKGISYHNKDILFKSLSEFYENVALDFYGLEGMPKIKELLPSEFPQVRADEKRSDTLFLLEDGSILMLEYESNNRILENHLKYIEYAQRILHRYYHKEKKIKVIRVVVIYTSDVTEVNEQFSAGDLKISSKAILLSEYNGDAILEKIKERMEAKIRLTDEELFKLSILPLMHSVRERQELIHDTVEVAKNIQDDYKQIQVIAGILTATDKFIDDEYAEKVREWLKMTKVARIFEREKKEAVEKAKKEKTTELAKSLLDILSVEIVAEKTGLDMEEVEKLKKET